MIKQLFAIVAFIFLIAGNTFALDDETKNKINSVLSEKIPELKVEELKDTPIAGISEINSGSEVYYITNDAKYIFFGELIDLNQDKKNWDITEQARKKNRIKLLDNTNQNGMIIFKPEEVKASVTIFTDIDCGYCRKMHKEIQAINDLGIEVRYLLFPRTGPNTSSFDKAISVWCAKDRNNALTQAKLGEDVEQKSCEHEIKSHFDLGVKIGIRGTPTLIFEDGTMMPSYLPPERLANIAMEHRNKN